MTVHWQDFGIMGEEVRGKEGGLGVGWSRKIANVTVIFQITSWIENEKKRKKNEVNELKNWDRHQDLKQLSVSNVRGG